MTAPFAEYELTSVPAIPEFECSMAVGTRLVLDPKVQTFCSRRPADTIFVKGSPALFALGWGGTRNHAIEFFDGAWWVSHLGHGSPLFVNGGRLMSAALQLGPGARVQPARGLEFTFRVRGELEALAADEKVVSLMTQPQGRPVLLDWLLERLGGDRASAERAMQHFAYRLAHSGTL